MESQELRPKGLLFHYTSVEGLVGILKSGSIFATHIRYLNDSQELFDSLAHVEGFISEFDPIMRPKLKSFLESAVRVFAKTVGAYVASFTDDSAALVDTEQMPGDRLNQWRAYSPPGKGFSLGFDPCVIDRAGLGQCLEGIDGMAYLHNCTYDRDMKRSLLQGVGGIVADDMREALIKNALWLFKESLDHGCSGASEDVLREWMKAHLSSQGYPDELRSHMMDARKKAMIGLVINATTLKNEAFFEEKEWRVVVLGSRLVKFRNGALGLTPYIELPLHLKTARSSLRKIVVGPTAHMDEAVQAAKMLLDELGIRQSANDYPEGVEVIPSQIPFRYW